MWEKLAILAAMRGLEYLFKRLEQERIAKQQAAESKQQALVREALERFEKYKEMK